MASNQRLKCSNPKASYQAHKVEIDAAIKRVLESGSYILGEEVERFEEEFADFIGVKHAIGVNSGTDALTIAMMAWKAFHPMDAITVPANTALATIAATIDAGVRPILVHPDSRAGLSVHLYGKAAVPGFIEDCAQACGGFYNGKRLGSFGTFGCFSFYPTKNLGAIGDGGMIVTSHDGLAEACREIREYGWGKERIPKRIGINSRLDPIQAAILGVKLKYLDQENERRRRIATMYKDGLPGQIKSPDSENHCFHLYVIECDKRDELAKHLRKSGIDTAIHYPRPIYKEPIYEDRVTVVRDVIRHVDRISGRILSLPMYPELADVEVERVIDCVRRFYS